MAKQQEPDNGDDVVAVPLRHPWRWVSGIVAVGLLLNFIYSVVSAESIQHDIVAKFLFDPRILQGALVTVLVTIVCMSIGAILATLLAVMKLSVNPLLRWIATGYIEFFRGTPLLLQIVFWGIFRNHFPRAFSWYSFHRRYFH
jgi:polar amino acid transport system permease protein